MKDGLYFLSMIDLAGCTREVSFTEEPTISDIHRGIEDWCNGGVWGGDGTSFVSWVLKLNGDKLDSGYYIVSRT